MQKAILTGRQRGAAIFAGIFGHLLFSLGWLGLGFLLLGGGLLLLFGASIGGIAGAFGDVQGISDFLSQAGAVIQVVGIVFAVISVLLMLLGFLVSGWILKGGRVRKPWATTLSAIVIAAILDLPLFVLYLFIAGKLTDTKVSGPLFLGPFVFVLGTIIVGVLIWLWMTWGHRGPAVVVERADGTSVTVTDSEAVSSIEAAGPFVAEPASGEPVVIKPAKAATPQTPTTP